MKLTFWCVPVIAVMLIGCVPEKESAKSSPQDQLQETTQPTVQDRLTWLGGTWARTTSRGTSFERWKADDTGLTGFVFRLENGDTLVSERLWIVSDGSDIFYVAHPSQNQEPTRFKMIKSDSLAFTVENPAHDFPTRITYRHDPPDSFVATITGPSGDSTQKIDFEFVRSD